MIDRSLSGDGDAREGAADPAGQQSHGRVAVKPARRNTWQREAVRDALIDADAFVSAQALHQQLAERGTKIGLATVYRALASLADEEQADTLMSTDGEAVYRACDMESHHHHLICRECGRAEEIEGEPVEQWAASVAAEHGYSEPRHIIDIFGTCPDCRARRSGR
ncbi:transcriptional repressor [Pseudoclavibacter endophyticus]|uniref:Transcriptional repressor n=1 Tax=Pseudoclavibacter endophyticus TaxID=1778590 RepID=A0A6H9WM31_9MICO|nr:Fur family transcriptional regulator [Pseudoclavibacter endophyticus]KAB1648871.1 transcriptional repressor [Pseudoclavibacter endophyticus]GGA67642.1 transcriptional repressor [Pseudoclavibacter endophyticus]